MQTATDAQPSVDRVQETSQSKGVQKDRLLMAAKACTDPV